MSRNLFTILFCVLVIVGVVFAYLIYSRDNFGSLKKGVLKSPSAVQNQPFNGQSIPSSFLESPKGTLHVPRSNASKKEIARFLVEAESASQKADALIIGAGCRPVPIIMEVRRADKLRVKNQDSITHTLMFNTTRLELQPHGESIVDLSPIYSPGVNGFGCDVAGNSGSAVGFLRVTE